MPSPVNIAAIAARKPLIGRLSAGPDSTLVMLEIAERDALVAALRQEEDHMKRGTALDGFELQKVHLLPNNGMEITADVNDSVCYVLRVDSRNGRVTVTWDGLCCFDNGNMTTVKP